MGASAIAVLGFGGLAVALVGCAQPCIDCYYAPAASSSYSSSSVPSTTSSTSSNYSSSSTSRVVTNRDGSQSIIFRKSGETTVAGPNGVTVIQRDPDGTRTIVNSSGGVRVVPPGSGHRRRR